MTKKDGCWNPGRSRGQLSRAGFFGCARDIGVAAMAMGAAAGASAAEASPEGTVRLKGKRDSKIKRWDVITIGNLSRVRYWGESDERSMRSAICTCTVIQGEGFRVLVDPSLKDAKAMSVELDRRTGLEPGEIDAVFITHQHGDHHFGLAHFPDASWLAGKDVAEGLNKKGLYPKKIEAAGGKIFDAIDVVPTPGHTMDHHSLRFDCDGFSVIVAGDAVPMLDFWRERRGYYNAVDFELSARTMDRMSELADIIVPGHDNYFVDVAIGTMSGER